MNEESADLGDPVREAVLETALRLLKERRNDEGFSDVDDWVTGTQIAAETEIDKEDVVETLRSLGQQQLHVRTADVGHDVEVLGEKHGEPHDT